MNFLERAWYESRPWLYLLWPCSMLFRGLTAFRRRRQRAGARRLGAQPVVVVGNITVGGAGKTSLLIALARELKRRGFSPGVVSRGFGAAAAAYPLTARADSDPAACGDEPVLIAASTGCPVVVDPDRPRALAHLLSACDIDLALSDDGLQHYRLHRDIEIAVVDGARMFGNGMCLPAGPLREPKQRLLEADLVVVNGEPAAALDLPAAPHRAQMEPLALVNLATGEERPFAGTPFQAGAVLQLVAGIGNPQRFYDLMRRLPYPAARIEFPDHHRFGAEDFDGGRIDMRQPVVMTEKDAVKCRRFARANFWALRAEMKLPREFIEELLEKIERSGKL